MQKIAGITVGSILLGLVSIFAHADPLMPSGADTAASQKQNSLIGRTFSLRGGNAFGAGLVSVGYAPASRTVVAAYFASVDVDYGRATILPDVASEDDSAKAWKKGDGFDVAYVNCKSKTYSFLAYPQISDLSNAAHSWFVRGETNRWDADISLEKSPKWAVDLPSDSRGDLVKFFNDICEATY